MSGMNTFEEKLNKLLDKVPEEAQFEIEPESEEDEESSKE